MSTGICWSLNSVWFLKYMFTAKQSIFKILPFFFFNNKIWLTQSLRCAILVPFAQVFLCVYSHLSLKSYRARRNKCENVQTLWTLRVMRDGVTPGKPSSAEHSADTAVRSGSNLWFRRARYVDFRWQERLAIKSRKAISSFLQPDKGSHAGFAPYWRSNAGFAPSWTLVISQLSPPL